MPGPVTSLWLDVKIEKAVFRNALPSQRLAAGVVTSTGIGSAMMERVGYKPISK